jgi:hypothetical protein
MPLWRGACWWLAVTAGAVGCGSDVSTRDAGQTPAGSSTHVQARQLFTRDPSLGVACGRASSIACDRVGLAVWLRQPASSVAATIDGQPLRLHAGGFGGRGPTYWEGYRQPAGLLAGPLKVTPDRGRFYWQGTHPKDARVTIRVRRRDGSTVDASLAVTLRAGWG